LGLGVHCLEVTLYMCNYQLLLGHYLEWCK